MKWIRLVVEHLKGSLRKLFSLKDTPHSIAGGVAIGVFMGFTPLFGLKTMMSIGAAYAMRCNMVAAAIAVSLHDVLFFLAPVLLRLEYEIGYWLLSHPHQHAPKLKLHDDSWKQLLKILTDADALYSVGLPLLVGSLFVAVPGAIIAYFITLAIARGRAKAGGAAAA